VESTSWPAISAEISMAQKRRISNDNPVKEPPEAPDPREQDELPARFRDISWREWLHGEFFRYWYLVGCLMVDFFLTLELIYLIPGNGGVTAGLLLLATAVIFEGWLYFKIWRH